MPHAVQQVVDKYPCQLALSTTKYLIDAVSVVKTPWNLLITMLYITITILFRQCWCVGRQFVQATGKQRPPLGASPRPGALAAAAKPPSVPNTPPIAAGPLPATALPTSSQVQGRAVLNHPLQVGPPAISLTAAPCCYVASLVSAETVLDC